MSRFDFMGLAPPGTPDAAVPVAASRAGAIGVVNLEFACDLAAALDQLARVTALTRGRCGMLVDASTELLANLLEAGVDGIDLVLLGGADAKAKAASVERVQAAGMEAYVVAMSAATAGLARDAGADAVIAKGVESGGWVGDEGSFVLVQRLLADVDIPVWVQGGVGRHTAAACCAAGATGAVLDSQLLLARESPLRERAAGVLRRFDGSETLCLGADLGAPVRVHAPRGHPALAELVALEQSLTSGADVARALRTWCDTVRERVDWRAEDAALLAIGQDACFADALAQRFVTVGGIIAGLRDGVDEHLRSARRSAVLSKRSPLAESHGTSYPLVQGPMTRVSDRPEFAASVADAGALPFLALALMRGSEAGRLLAQTSGLIGDRPWGVGILGFVPPELRAEQLKVILEHRPPFALIAGGRPDQARALEDEGIATYLHVPSPALLELYLKDGARRFVFEGRECGGHVGPRTSLVLWETMLDTLLDGLPAGAQPDDLHVLLAGGVHDALSAAMAATAAGTLAGRGARIGMLMGTSYLFTHEAVRDGAITARFQKAALSCAETVLLETGPGHTTRCLPSPFVEEFTAEKRRLRERRLPAEEVRARLETMNIGRLRLAAKGVDRNPRHGSDPAAPKLTRHGEREQWKSGMYMIGQVAALQDHVCSLSELHERVVDDGAQRIAALAPRERRPEPAPPPADAAIVGMGCILPGAPGVEELWTNILEKVDSITEVPADRWDWRRYFDADRTAADKIYSRWGGFIEDVPFDPVMFGMPPMALPSIEPFQLLGLLVAQAALRDAGYAERPFPRERTSVIFGAGGGGADLASGYTVRASLPMLFGDGAGELTARLADALPLWTEDSFAGILMNVTAGRIANRLDLGGMNYTVDAACASSLAAICLAVSHLQAGTTDMVVAGGVDAIQNPFGYLCFSKTQALSPNGRCRPFDADADGIAISEGFAAVVLKRLADAERDGDHIYAVIRGAAGASDGRDRSLTAPRPEGQMRALRRAYAQAGHSPAGVGLIEAHGTGTVAGDRAEVDALRSVLEQAGAQPQATAIGSVKSNIGHTKATAGVAGIIKATLALHRRVLPPTIVRRPNPQVSAAGSPLYVNAEARPWLQPRDGSPRRAGVSSFGFGGTDFHVALEEYTRDPVREQAPAVVRWPAELFVWRGESRGEIRAAVDRLLDELDNVGEQARLIDAAHHVARAAAREGARANLAFAAESLPDLLDKLRAARELLDADVGSVHRAGAVHYSERPLAADGDVAFIFPGQGSQCVNMARELAVIFPEVRECFERADAVLADRFERPLSSFIFPPPALDPDDERRQQSDLTETSVAQPALGATELALLGVLRRLGVEPGLVAGHSYGELVALAAAGAFDDATLIALSEARGRFIRSADDGKPGAMAAIDAPPQTLEPLLSDPQLVLANLNGPHQTVVSGARESIERAVTWCRQHDLEARRLPVACAFHSPAMAPAQGLLAAWLAERAIQPPRIPVYSNTTGGVFPSDATGIAARLADQLVNPVLFAREIESMHAAGARLFVEVGPRSVLTGLVGRILEHRPHVCVPTDRPGRPGLAQLLDCLATLAAEGVALDVAELFRGRAARDLKPAPPPSPTTWLVNGGRARPMHTEARPAPAPPVRVMVLDAAPNASAGNGADASRAGAELVAAASHANGAGAGADSVAQSNGSAARAASTSSAPVSQTEGDRHEQLISERRAGVPASVLEPEPEPGADRVNDVMCRHQELMRHFLETQRTVMLAYLSSRSTGPEELRPLVPQPSLSVAPASVSELPEVSASPVTVRDTARDVPTSPTAPAQPARTLPPAAAPAPAQTAAPPPEDHGDGRAPPTREQLTEALIGVVSDRTGFPREMLTLDADLEADLSLDSIKRVEIAGTMLHTLPLPDGASPAVEQVTAGRTLRQMVAALEAIVLEAAGTATANGSAAESNGGASRPFEERPVDQRIGRCVPRAVRAARAASDARLASEGAVVVVDDETGVGAALERALQERGHRVLRRSAADGAIDEPVAALVHLGALRSSADDWQTLLERDLLGLFTLARALQEQLLQSAARGGAAVLAATRLDGAFAAGCDSADGAPGHGLLSGFAKSLAQEWPAVRVRSVAVEPAPADVTAQRLLTELLTADEDVEIGYRDGQRMRLELVDRPLGERPEAISLDEHCVIVATGGARGITAEAVLALARLRRPTVVIVGRTQLADEDPRTSQISDPAQLKQTLAKLRREQGDDATLAAVEHEFRRLLAVREVRRNLARLRDGGARVEYVTCDVRDADLFGEVIDHIYATHGRIDGVIHGAGVIEDKLIADKQPESVRRVVETKLAGAYALAERLRPEQLRFLAFFGSVAGRFGNRGQADYAAASDELNRLAHELDRRWDARVMTINWGPWRTTGMVSPELEREFARRGVHLIPRADGCRMFLEELALGGKAEPEVVIAGGTALDGRPVAVTPRALALVPDADGLERAADGSVSVLVTLDPDDHLYLHDHRIDGRPVLPFAVAIELMAELAAAGWPQLDVVEVGDVRLLNGVIVGDGAPPRVRVTATPAARGRKLLVDVAIVACDEPVRTHYRAVVELRARDAAPAEPAPEWSPTALDDLSPFPMEASEAYERYLFHGPLLRGIVAIEGMDARGARAILRPSLPSRCLRAAPAGAWMVDPVLLDCALQVQLLWARIHWDVTVLPTEIRSVRRLEASPTAPLRPESGAELVRVELRVRPESQPPVCRADHIFTNTRGRPLTTLTDVLTPGSPALNRVAGLV